jgi:predicted amidohydrolase
MSTAAPGRAGNLQRLQQLAMEAKGADLLVLPEMFLSGYNIGLEAVSAWPRSTTANRRNRSVESPKPPGSPSLRLPERTADGQIYNAVQLIDAHGERLCNYRKTHLFGDLDRSMFSPGPMIFRWSNSTAGSSVS